MEKGKSSYKKRSMLYEIESEKNPYKKAYVMKKWYKHMVRDTLRNVKEFFEQLSIIQLDTAYMLKNCPREGDFDKFLEDINSRKREEGNE